MDSQALLLFHVGVSLVAIVGGIIVVYGLLTAKRMVGITNLFLATTALTSLTGYLFHRDHLLPSQVVGAIALVTLAVTALALYVYRLHGAWRAVYVIGATLSLYFNVFVLVAQGFLKIAALHALAPTGSEPPFAIAQAVVLLVFVAIGFAALRRFHPVAVWVACIVLASVIGLAGTRSAYAAGETQSIPTDCGRHCLLAILTTYTEALVDNDTSRLALSPQLRVTSNGAVTSLGKGQVWGSVKRIPYRHAFVDPISGAAVFYGTLTNSPSRDGEKWWFYVVRLKIVRQQVTEIEEISYDGMLGGTPASSLDLPHSIYDTYLPSAERSPRAQLFAIADKYFDAVTGSLNYHDVPWHPECQRIELGTFTVNSKLGPGSCGGEFKDPKVRWTVRNRRFYIADEERGVVLAIGNFMTPPELPNNNGSVVFEVFKIQDGLIRHIEAFFRGNGQLHSGWGDGPGS